MSKKWTAEQRQKFLVTMKRKRKEQLREPAITKSESKSISVAQKYHVLMAEISRRISEINSEISRLISERAELENLIPNALDKSDYPDYKEHPSETH